MISRRKKGYQIAALAMTVVVTGSSFVGCGTKKEEGSKEQGTTVVETTIEETTVEETTVVETTIEETTKDSSENIADVTDAYNQYIKEELVPAYGVADLSNFNAKIEQKQSGNYYITDRKINLEGVASAYIDDMNADGVDDMIVVRYKEDVETESKHKLFNMVIGAYTIKDGQVSLLDEIDAGATILEKEPAGRDVYVNAITDGKNKYIMVENYEAVQVFADGSSEYNKVYQLDVDGEKLIEKYSFEQTAGGSAAFEFTGFIDGEGTILWRQEPYYDEEEPGVYDSYEEAIVGFYADLGISIGVSEDRQGIILGESLVNNIFTYDWNLTTWNTEDMENVWAEYEQIAKDYTNVLEIAGISAEDIAKITTEAGSSEDAKKVFEKIQTNSGFAGPLLLTAITLQSTFSEEIENDWNYYYWKSVSWALPLFSNYEEIFEGYDVQFVDDEEKGETYYVVEPRVIDLLAMVFTGSYTLPTAIPYEHPEFAEQEPESFSYPYMITYNEEEDRYYVRYGEDGSLYFTDCTYVDNKNDTMTITGKYTTSSSGGDEYLINNYEITIGYDPANEVFGFTILDVKKIQ